MAFAGTRRYAVHGPLGRGGVGAVWAAHDRRLDLPVALKTLARPSPEDAFILKREFRLLADVRHPNLVELYELEADAETPFIAMELVADARHVLDDAAEADVLRDRLRQLADGLAALHARGRVHGDLKASNVLVDRAGRVVIVDFGLSLDVDVRPTRDERALAGTPGWLAPERLRGEPATPASDWYALGALIALATTGELPVALPTRVLIPEVPEPLSELVAGLLAPAARRAGHAEVMRHLGGEVSSVERSARFVGRARELEVIAASIARDDPSTLVIVGESGIGKSALVARAAARAEADGTLVLRGRGRMRETVSFPVLDAVTDDLSRYLLASEVELPTLSPIERLALHRLFPVLGRVPGLVDPEPAELEPQLAWRAGVAGLARLLATLASRQRVVLWLDDIQWLDTAATRVLRALFRRDDAPPLHVIVTQREASTTELARWAPEPLQTLALGGLDGPDAAALAAELGATSLRVVGLGGSPFLIERAARAGNLTSEVERLAPDARVAAELVAASARPLALDTLGAALHEHGVASPRLWSLVSALESHRLARLVRVGASWHVEAYHERVRAAVLEAASAAARAQANASLARALLRDPTSSAAEIAAHFAAAGEAARATEQATRAAAEARQALAFDRAVELLELAVALAGDAGRELGWALAEARAAAGRSAEAARDFEALAERDRSAGRPHLDALRLAAEHWLRIGDTARGTAALRTVVEASGLWFPTTQRRALIDVVRQRLVLMLFGYRVRPEPVGGVSAERLARLDAAWSATLGLNTIDILRSASFQARHTRLALAAGETSRVIKALSTEVAYLACEGGRSSALAERLAARVERIATEHGAPDLLAFVDLCLGTGHFYAGKWQPALARLAQAEARYQRLRGSGAWEIVNCGMYRLWSLAYAGELRRLGALMPTMVAAAEQDRHAIALAGFCSGASNVHWLAADQPELARERALAGAAPFASVDFQSPQFVSLLSQCRIDLYERRGRTAWDRLAAHWARIRALQFLRVQFFRVELWFLRGVAALAAADAEPAQAVAFTREARRAETRLRGEKTPRAKALAAVLAAGHAAPSRPERLAEAAVLAEREGLALTAAGARWRLMELGQGRAPEWFVLQRVVAPERLVATVLPT